MTVEDSSIGTGAMAGVAVAVFCAEEMVLRCLGRGLDSDGVSEIVASRALAGRFRAATRGTVLVVTAEAGRCCGWGRAALDDLVSVGSGWRRRS